MTLTQFSTVVGVVVVGALWRGRLPFPVVRPGAGAPIGVAVVGVPAVFAVLAAGSWARGSGSWSPADLKGSLGWVLLTLLGQLLGAAGEEVAWRGVVQPALETRMDVLPAAAVTGTMFGLGHLQVLAAGGLGYGGFVVSAIALSVILADVTAGRPRGGRVLVATLVHWVVNVTIWWGFDGGSETLTWAALTVVALGTVAVCTTRVRRRRNARGERMLTPR